MTVVTGVVVAVLLASGCTAANGEATDGEGDVDAGPDAVDVADRAAARERAVGERLTPDGTIPLDLALDLFATGYGPIDGGSVDDALGGGTSGTATLTALLRHWDELTPAQRDAVDSAFPGPDDDSADSALPGSGDGAVGSAPASPDLSTTSQIAFAARTDSSTEPLPDLSGLLLRLRQELEGRLGFRMLARVGYTANEHPADSRWAASAGPMRDGRLIESGPMTYCHIQIYPGGRELLGTDTFEALMAHELTHCLEYAMVDDVGPVLASPQWVLEGFAEFAAATIGPAEYAAGAWESWLEEPEFPLTRREYSGIGAFAAAEQSGVDVWDRYEQVQGHPHRRALETLFGTTAEQAMTTISQTLVREPVLGSAWEVAGPGVTDLRGTAGFGVSDGSDVTERIDLVPYGTAPYTIELRGEVVDVEVEGALGRIGLPGGGTSEVTSTTTARFCVAGSCECPDGGHMGGTEIPDDGVLGIALTTTELAGALDRTQRITMRIHVPTVDEACATRPAAEILVVRVTAPTPFEIHGGHCLLQDNGVILVQAGQDRYPPGYRLPDAHLDDASIDIVKDPPTPPHYGTVTLRLAGVEQPHDDQVHLDADLLGGTFRTGNGVVGEWRCAALVTPDELFGSDG